MPYVRPHYVRCGASQRSNASWHSRRLSAAPFFFNRCGPRNVSRIRYTAGGFGWDMPQGARRVGGGDTWRPLTMPNSASSEKWTSPSCLTDDPVDRCSSIWQVCVMTEVRRTSRRCQVLPSAGGQSTGWRSGVPLQAGEKRPSLLLKSRPALGPKKHPIQCAPGALSPGVKR